MASNKNILQWIKAKQIRTNKGLPIEFKDHGFLLDYIKDTHNRIVCRKCTHPDTMVLTADLKWVKIKDVKKGDLLIGVNETCPKKRGSRRKFEETTVNDKWKVRKEGFKMTLEDGRSVIASADHPFLSTKRGKSAWKTIKELKIGDGVRVLFDPWKSESDFEEGWMSGFMDGEASLKCSRKSGGSDFVLSQRPGKVSNRVENYLKKYNFKYHVRDDYNMGDIIHRNGPVRRMVLSRFGDIVRLLGQTQITRWIDLKFWDGIAFGITNSDPYIKIKSIESVGKINMIDIETSNHTFIAEGIPTHNCTQIGASFSTLVKILHLGDQEALTTIYSLPTSAEAKNFVVSKVDPMVERSPGLLAMVQKVVLRNQILYNTVVKRIGESYYFFKGSWTALGAQSIDSDIIVIDELDFQKPEIRSMWEERTEGSASQDIIYWIGYPSVPNFGIEELYESSDQRKWFIECPSCFKRQVLEFPDNIDIATEKYICKYCKKELSDDMRRKGIWKVTKPGRSIHGYWINKLMAPWIPASKIVNRFKKDTAKKFHNYTLGLPFVSKETELTDTIVQKAMIDEEELASIKSSEDVRVFCGIDQGDIFHVLVAVATPNCLVITAAEQHNDEDKLLERLKFYSPDMVVMDMFPNRHTAKKLCREYGTDKFFMAKERNWTEISKARNYWNLNRATSEIGVERTESLDAMLEYVMKGAVRFRRTIPRLLTEDKRDPGVIRQLKNLVPDTQERNGRMRRVFKAVGPEHYGHALNFLVVACHISFPGWMNRQALVHSSYLNELKNKKAKPWYVRDFEERIQGLNPHDTIIIKASGEIIEPNDDFYPRVC